MIEWMLSYRHEEIDEIVKKTKHAMRIRDIGLVFECACFSQSTLMLRSHSFLC